MRRIKARYFFLPTLVLFLLSVAPRVVLAAEEDPKATIQTAYDGIRTILESTDDDAQMREKIRGAMADFVDYEMFAKLAAKKFWDQLASKQQSEYSELFQRLIQRTYLKRFKANKPFKFDMTEEAEFNTAKTKARLLSLIESGKMEAEVAYKLYQPKGKTTWWAYDVVIDDVSVMRNYRTSFNKTWEKGGWDLLISKMRKKLDTVDKSDDEDVGSLE